MAETRRLYRSESDRMLAGVCGGLGRFFGVDPTLVRIAFVLFAFLGWGVLLYLALWAIVPRESRLDAAPREVFEDALGEARQKAEAGATELRRAYHRVRDPHNPESDAG